MNVPGTAQVSLGELQGSLCEKTTGKDSSAACALPAKTAQFTQFFRQV